MTRTSELRIHRQLALSHFTRPFVSERMPAVVRAAPPVPEISVTIPPCMLNAWFLVPALQFVKNTGRMDEMPSTIHSAVAPIEVRLPGGVMPMLMAWLVVLFNIEQNPWFGW